MQANLERLGQLERRLSVAVPMAEIESEVQNRLKRLSRTVKLHGFRPGKVPLKVVAQQFGSQIRQEVIGDTLQKSFGEAVKQQNLRVVGSPRFETRPPAEGASEFVYSATFEVYPDIVLGDLSRVAIVRPHVEVGEAEVDKTIEIMRRQRAVFEPVERPAQAGDRLTIDYRGTIDGAEFEGSSASDHQVMLGEGRLLADFEKQLIGMKAGENRTFELRFPEDYHGKAVAGKTAVFEVTVKSVAAPKLPEIDAAFARSLGIADGDVGRMRAEVKANLEREVKLRLKNRVKDQIMQALLDTTELAVPKALVELEVERLRRLTRAELAARGIPVRDDTPLPSEVFEKHAKRRVSLGLILGELVKVHGLHPRPEQVRAAVEEQAESYEHPEEVVKWFYQSRERLRDIEAAVIEDNVVNWALGVVQVKDEPMAFDALMGNRS